MISGGMAPLKLLSERSNSSKFWHFARLEGMLPWRLFPLKRSESMLVRFPIEEGMEPEKRLPKRYNLLRFWSLAMLEGMLPESLLSDAWKLFKLMRFSIPIGRLPTIWFWSKDKCQSFLEKLLICSGNCPPKLLTPICMASRVVVLTKDERKFKSSSFPLPRLLVNTVIQRSLWIFSREGTLPENWFSSSWSTSKFEALDIELGMVPVNWFLEMEKKYRFGREMPKSGGRVPWIW